MGTKFSNDSTKSRLGDHYQYVNILEMCLNGKEGETIYIEQRGDAATEDTSVEIKHHESETHYLTDRHVDFWKTLKNLVENHKVITTYKALVLLTTSKINIESKLSGWNEYSKEEKLVVIKQIKEDNTAKTIEPFIDKIFNYKGAYSENILLSILDRFSISSDNPNVKAKLAQLQNLPQLKTIPSKNRAPFLGNLLGFIRNISLREVDDMEIRISEFDDYLQSTAAYFMSDTIPIPDLYRTENANPVDYRDYDFVKEIENIKLDIEVPGAVNDYYRAHKTIIYLTESDPLTIEEINYYKNEIIAQDLHYIKREIDSDVSDKADIEDCLKKSKKCYYTAMRHPVKPIKGYNPNQDFFQRGTMHMIVDDKKFFWLIE